MATRAEGFLAAADLDVAAAAACAERNLLAPAVFHWQQAAEKSLKAILSHAGRPFGPTHDLRKLADEVRLFVSGNHAWPSATELIDLTRAYIESRYPIEVFSNESPTTLVDQHYLDQCERIANFFHLLAKNVISPERECGLDERFKP